MDPESTCFGKVSTAYQRVDERQGIHLQSGRVVQAHFPHWAEDGTETINSGTQRRRREAVEFVLPLGSSFQRDQPSQSELKMATYNEVYNFWIFLCIRWRYVYDISSVNSQRNLCFPKLWACRRTFLSSCVTYFADRSTELGLNVSQVHGRVRFWRWKRGIGSTKMDLRMSPKATLEALLGKAIPQDGNRFCFGEIYHPFLHAGKWKWKWIYHHFNKGFSSYFNNFHGFGDCLKCCRHWDLRFETMLERPLAARSTGDAVRLVAPQGVSWTSMAFHGVSWCFYVLLRGVSGSLIWCWNPRILLRLRFSYLDRAKDPLLRRHTEVHADETHDRDRWFVTILLGKP